jgi:acyl-CoA thioesterase-1
LFSFYLRFVINSFILAGLWLPACALANTTLLVFGDSLSAAYGIPVQQGWVNLLAQKLEQRNIQVVNASISGETTSGGLTRIETTLVQHKPKIVVVELGANDGLRGLPVKQMEQNLAAIIRASQQAGAKVLLLGMKIPPNYGPQYTRDFSNAYAALARQFKTGLVPFFLEGVAGNPALIQQDGLHPTAEAQPKLLENIRLALESLLQTQ